MYVSRIITATVLTVQSALSYILFLGETILCTFAVLLTLPLTCDLHTQPVCSKKKKDSFPMKINTESDNFHLSSDLDWNWMRNCPSWLHPVEYKSSLIKIVCSFFLRAAALTKQKQKN